MLAFSAKYYASGYAGPSTDAIVGAYNQRTGVCAVGQAWAIEPKEGVRFALGSNPAVSGRLIARAEVALQRNDKTGASATAQLVELRYVSNQSGSSCKSYTDFSASSTRATPFGKLVNFSTTPTPGALINAHIDWGTFANCRPGVADSGVPTCPTTYIDFQDGTGEHPQVLCEAAAPPATPPWCTTGKRFGYETVNGVLVTRITEDWSGFGDPKFSTR